MKAFSIKKLVAGAMVAATASLAGVGVMATTAGASTWDGQAPTLKAEGGFYLSGYGYTPGTYVWVREWNFRTGQLYSLQDFVSASKCDPRMSRSYCHSTSLSASIRPIGTCGDPVSFYVEDAASRLSSNWSSTTIQCDTTSWEWSYSR